MEKLQQSSHNHSEEKIGQQEQIINHELEIKAKVQDLDLREQNKLASSKRRQR